MIDGSGMPVNFNAVDLCSRAETEVQTQIVLRKIAATAVNFIGLRHSAGDDFDAGVEGEAIAFGSSELETDPMTPWNAGIFQ